MIDEDMARHWGLLAHREVPGRGDCAVQRFIYTCGLLVGLELNPFTNDYKARYCYETAAEAIHALDTWDGTGDPPGDWIKEKVSERTRVVEIPV